LGEKHSGNAHQCGAAPLPCRTIGPGLCRLSLRFQRARRPVKGTAITRDGGGHTVALPASALYAALCNCGTASRSGPIQGFPVLISVPNRRRSTNDPDVPSASGNGPLTARVRTSFNQNSCVPSTSFLYHEVSMDGPLGPLWLTALPPRSLRAPVRPAMARGAMQPVSAFLFSPHCSETRPRGRLLETCGSRRVRLSETPQRTRGPFGRAHTRCPPSRPSASETECFRDRVLLRPLVLALEPAALKSPLRRCWRARPSSPLGAGMRWFFSVPTAGTAG